MYISSVDLSILLSLTTFGRSSGLIAPSAAASLIIRDESDVFNHRDPVTYFDQTSPVPEKSRQEHVRLVVLSDTHGHHWELPKLPDGDVLIHLGDAANQGSLDDIRSFTHWISECQRHRFPEIVLVGGNHDRDRINPQNIQLKKEYKDFIYLHDEIHSLANDRLVVYGASWDSCEEDEFLLNHRSERNSKSLQNSRKDGVDIFLTHKNPYADGGIDHGWDGSKEISRILKDQQIPMHLFGHVHRGRGIKHLAAPASSELLKKYEKEEDIIMVNCASAWDQPVVIDWDPVAKKPAMIHCPIPNFMKELGVSTKTKSLC